MPIFISFPGKSKDTTPETKKPFSLFLRQARAKEVAEKCPDASNTMEQTLAGAEALVDIAPLAARLKSCPVTKHAQSSATVSFPAAGKDRSSIGHLAARLKLKAYSFKIRYAR
jgi:hypothetical protein